jgi:hypothetical protein
MDWIIEDQAFSPSYDSAPAPSPLTEKKLHSIGESGQSNRKRGRSNRKKGQSNRKIGQNNRKRGQSN